MTCEQFNLLDPEDQKKQIKAALPMGARTEGNTTVKFYKLDGFYVEVYFNPKYHTVTKYVATIEQDFIRLYLNI